MVICAPILIVRLIDDITPYKVHTHITLLSNLLTNVTFDNNSLHNGS